MTAGKVAAIGVGPSTGGVVFSGGTRGEIYRTDDPADPSPTWIYAGSGLPNRSVTSIAVAPDEQTVYATLSGTGTAHIYKSTNRGSTWAGLSLANGLPDEPFDSIVIHPADPLTLYAGSDFGVYASFDGGATWSPYGTGLPRVAVDSLQISAQQSLLQAGTHGRGLWQAAAQTSGVLNVAPTATPSSGGAPLSVSFGATAVGGTSPYTYAWTFGDGGSGSGATVSHTYNSLGTFTATVTVTDASERPRLGLGAGFRNRPSTLHHLRGGRDQPAAAEDHGVELQERRDGQDRRHGGPHDHLQERHTARGQGFHAENPGAQGPAGFGDREQSRRGRVRRLHL